jgi:DNA-binding SARP family transcriptional activator
LTRGAPPPDLASRGLRGLRKATVYDFQSFASHTLPSYNGGGRDGHIMSGADDDTAIGKGETGRLRLNIIGNFAASVDGREFSLSRKAQALLGYMILTSSRQLPRTKLIGLLWSEKEDPLAKGSLRQSLSQIQRELKTLGCTHFHANQVDVIFEIEHVACDVMEIVSDAEHGIINPVLLAREHLTDSILDDFEGIDPAFSDWLAQTRPLFHERLIDALTRLLPDEGQTTVSAAAEAAAKAIYRLDCENERAVRVLIKSHVAEGNIGAALAVYARLWRQLEDTYDIEPHKLTQDLIASVRQQQPEAAPPVLASAAAPAVGQTGLAASPPSIAVLPFLALSPNLEPQFTIGIVDSVIQALSSLKELFVISRGSTMISMSPTQDLRAVGRDLNVQYLLHGNIQRAGELIRMTTELVAAETVEVVRADRLSGTVAATRSRIASTITSARSRSLTARSSSRRTSRSRSPTGPRFMFAASAITMLSAMRRPTCAYRRETGMCGSRR